MNGRVYDPLVARFLSADPIIQEPEHSQSYNRYTYVWNNPTNLTDPTGFFANGTGANRATPPEGDRHTTSITSCATDPSDVSCNDKTNERNCKGTDGSGGCGTSSAGQVAPAQGGASQADDKYEDFYTQDPVFPNEITFRRHKIKPMRDFGAEEVALMLEISANGIPFERPLVWGYRGYKLWRAGRIVERIVEPAAAKALPPLRQAYVDSIAELKLMGENLRAAGATTEDLARALHAERRLIGEEFKALTPPEKLAEIYERNLEKYGDKLGPTVDWLRAQGKSLDQIIESATRTGGKDLGF
jgi:hypothetical protein